MGKKDPRVDAYIAKAADFARPILKRLRKAVHTGCPGVVETVKWGMPSFEHRGILCGMAAFKEHCAFGFWKGALIVDAKSNRADEAMGQFGRIRSVANLPDEKTLVDYVRKAAELNETGVKTPRTIPKEKKPLKVPPYFRAALAKNRKALATFEGFSTTNKREYVDWVSEAKTETTREKRLSTAVEWMAQGKIRNWKYARRGGDP